VPWELYHASLTDQTPNPEFAYHPKQTSISSLRRMQIGYLVIIMLSPFLGGAGLWFAKKWLLSENGLVAQVNVGVFIVASAVRPLGLLGQLLEQKSVHLQQQAAIRLPEPLDSTDKEMLRACLDRMTVLEDLVVAVDQSCRLQTQETAAVVKDELEKTKSSLTKKFRDAVKTRASSEDDYLRVALEKERDSHDARMHAMEEQLVALRGHVVKEEGMIPSAAYVVGYVLGMSGRVVSRVVFFPLNLTKLLVNVALRPLGLPEPVQTT